MDGRVLAVAAAAVSVVLIRVAPYLGLLGLGAVLALPPIWCLTWLRCPRIVPLASSLLAASVAVAAWAGTDIGQGLVLYGASGMAAGWSLSRAGRWDLRLLVTALPLAPLLLQTEGLDLVIADSRAAMQEMLSRTRLAPPPHLDPAQLDRTLAAAEQTGEQLFLLMRRYYPGCAALSQLGAAACTLLVGSVVARRWGGRCRPARVPALWRWTVPFYTVWLLAAGTALVLLRREPLQAAGENLMLVAVALLAVHGLAIQAFVVRRFLTAGQQWLFWLLLGPVVAAGGAILGLLDQWLDLRRGPRGADSEDG